MKRLSLIMACIFTVILLLTACSGDKDDSKTGATDEYSQAEETQAQAEGNDGDYRETLLCFQDDMGYLVPVMVEIPWEEGIAKAALKKMVNSDSNNTEVLTMGLNALIPGDTKINGLSISDGLAKVDFSKEVMNCSDAISENNMVQGVVLTLTAFPTIDKVQFLVDGQVVDKLTYGTAVGEPLGPKAINLEGKKNDQETAARATPRATMSVTAAPVVTATPGGKTKGNTADGEDNVDSDLVTVFYQATSSTNFTYLVPVSRFTTTSNVEAALDELVNGPADDTWLKTGIPEGTELTGVQLEDGTLYVDFTEPFNQLKDDPAQERIVMKEIAATVGEYSDVETIKVLVDGEDYDYDVSIPTFANSYN